MIICICGSVTEQQILEAINFGLSIDEVMQTLNCAMQCGCCFPQLTKIMETPDGTSTM